MIQARLLDMVYAAHRYLAELESVPRDYGTGEALYSSEIHTVVAVRDDPGINLTELARSLGVSPAAASKFAAKLVMRGYLEKYQADGNRRDVLFRVTERGRVAAKGHGEFERKTFAPLLRIEKSVAPEQRAAVGDYLSRLIAAAR